MSEENPPAQQPRGSAGPQRPGVGTVPLRPPWWPLRPHSAARRLIPTTGRASGRPPRPLHPSVPLPSLWAWPGQPFGPPLALAFVDLLGQAPLPCPSPLPCALRPGPSAPSPPAASLLPHSDPVSSPLPLSLPLSLLPSLPLFPSPSFPLPSLPLLPPSPPLPRPPSLPSLLVLQFSPCLCPALCSTYHLEGESSLLPKWGGCRPPRTRHTALGGQSRETPEAGTNTACPGW